MSNYVNNATPINNKVLLKWSALKVVRSEDKQRPYKLVKTPLVELVKSAEYSQFRDRFNWLYRNYNPENYQLVWNELQEFNARRIQKCFQDNAIEIADAKMQKTIDNAVAHFGEMPAWIQNLHKGFEIHFNYGLKSDTTPYCDTGLYFVDATLDTRQAFSKVKAFVKSKGVNLPDRKIWRRTKIVDVRQQTKAKRELLLDRARTCYGLHPEYELCTVETKQLCNVSERYIKEYSYTYQQKFYLNTATRQAEPTPIYTGICIDVSEYDLDTFTKRKQKLFRKIKEFAQKQELKLSDRKIWRRIVVKTVAQESTPIYYSNEELSKAGVVAQSWQTLVGRVSIEVEKLRKLAEDAVIRDAKWMAQFDNTDLDMRELREVKDTIEHNKMVPITDLQGPDSPYDIPVEFIDFLEPIYADEAEDI